LAELVGALANEMRIELLQILSRGPLPAPAVFAELSRNGSDIKYRESVYKGLEVLVDAGLVDKVYDKKNKKILYSLVSERLDIDFTHMQATIGVAEGAKAPVVQ